MRKIILGFLIFLAMTSYSFAQAPTIVRTVRPGGTVHLMNQSFYDVTWCYSQAPQPDTRPAPRLGQIASTVFRKDLTQICKQMLFRAVFYRAGRTRGTDRFTLYFIDDGESVDYEVTIHVR